MHDSWWLAAQRHMSHLALKVHTLQQAGLQRHMGHGMQHPGHFEVADAQLHLVSADGLPLHVARANGQALWSCTCDWDCTLLAGYSDAQGLVATHELHCFREQDTLRHCLMLPVQFKEA